MTWRDRLQPASFRGVPFYVEQGGHAGGRRIVPHEFPKRDVGYAEDMGRRSKRFSVSAYLIGADYDQARDALIDALIAEGAGSLVLPMMRGQQVVVDNYTASETQERGGYCQVDIGFIEAGTAPFSAPLNATQAQVQSKAAAAGAVAATSADKAASEVIKT